MQRFSGKQALQIDIASNYGLDKEDWQVRLDWFEQHQSHLREMLPQAESPALFFAGVLAWEATQRSEATGYPISIDATASGLQIFACLTGDRSAAELCNVVNTGHRQDAYTGVYRTMLAKVGEAAQIKRDQVKGAVMTAFYGSKAEPKKVFGEGKLLQVFEETMEELAPAAWELNQVFLKIWDPDALVNEWVLPDNFHVRVKVMTPVTESVNFLNAPYDIQRNINAPTKEGRSLSANTVHSIDGMIVREMVRRCDYDPSWVQLIRDLLNNEVESRFTTQDESQEAHRMVEILWKHYEDSGYLSARILDYLDSDTLCLVDASVIRELVESLPEKPFKVVSVHDCFRCLPNYANDLRRQYNQQLYEIARSNLLGFLLSQLVGRQVSIGKLDPTLANDILESDYALS